MRSEPITRYEHERLLLRDPDVDERLIESLEQYHGKDGTPYFDLIHKGVKFNQFVGVIQVGRQTIEILPKVDRLVEDTDRATWRGVLIQMLRITSGIRAEATSSADLKTVPNSIFDLYIEWFLKECEFLVHRGLIKRYNRRKENKYALKGRLDIPGQIRHNLVHKERFHVEYSDYNPDHRIHHILKRTLIVLTHLTAVPSFHNRIKRLLLYFEDIADVQPSVSDFSKITYGRKNLHYRKALQIARLILLNYHPDIQRGRQDVLALMFDMNNLWEQYIAHQFRRHLSDRYTVSTQKSSLFWSSEQGKKRLRPDIILTDKSDPDRKIILDTKWKLPSNKVPSDPDLRQMFAYNRLFDSTRSMLLYPGPEESIKGTYQTEYGGECRVVLWPVVDDEGRLIESKRYYSNNNGKIFDYI